MKCHHLSARPRQIPTDSHFGDVDEYSFFLVLTKKKKSAKTIWWNSPIHQYFHQNVTIRGIRRMSLTQGEGGYHQASLKEWRRTLGSVTSGYQMGPRKR